MNGDGSSYEGGWADDRREGQGIWKSSDGELYDGHWHSDKVLYFFLFAPTTLLVLTFDRSDSEKES